MNVDGTESCLSGTRKASAKRRGSRAAPSTTASTSGRWRTPTTSGAKVAEQQVTWFKKWDKVQDWKYSKEEVHVKWFVGGKLNISYNCLDRHLIQRGDQTAIIWEGNEPERGPGTSPTASSTRTSASSPTCSRAWA